MRRSRRAVGGDFEGARIRRVTTNDVTTTTKRTCGKAAPVRACDTASAASRYTLYSSNNNNIIKIRIYRYKKVLN